MRILVFGQSGQVAAELAAAHTSHSVHCLSRANADLTDPAGCAAAIASYAPDAVINAAAYTAVDQAEKEQERANQINGAAPAAMAQACQTQDIPFIHLSTDYVFDGTGDAPFQPHHPTAPLGVYGRSKRIGELGVQSAGGRFAILRTSWVFSAHGTNFLKTMLRLGAERDRLTIVADQIGGPTPAQAIATACLSLTDGLVKTPEHAGVYHFSGAPDVSWAEFARHIFDCAGFEVDVKDIPTRDYPTPATRPLNSRLDCQSLMDAFGIARPDWRLATTQIVASLRA